MLTLGGKAGGGCPAILRSHRSEKSPANIPDPYRDERMVGARQRQATGVNPQRSSGLSAYQRHGCLASSPPLSRQDVEMLPVHDGTISAPARSEAFSCGRRYQNPRRPAHLHCKPHQLQNGHLWPPKRPCHSRVDRTFLDLSASASGTGEGQMTAVVQW